MKYAIPAIIYLPDYIVVESNLTSYSYSNLSSYAPLVAYVFMDEVKNETMVGVVPIVPNINRSSIVPEPAEPTDAQYSSSHPPPLTRSFVDNLTVVNNADLIGVGIWTPMFSGQHTLIAVLYDLYNQTPIGYVAANVSVQPLSTCLSYQIGHYAYRGSSYPVRMVLNRPRRSAPGSRITSSSGTGLCVSSRGARLKGIR